MWEKIGPQPSKKIHNIEQSVDWPFSYTLIVKERIDPTILQIVKGEVRDLALVTAQSMHACMYGANFSRKHCVHVNWFNLN